MNRLMCALGAGAAFLFCVSPAGADEIVHTGDVAHPGEFTPSFAASRVGASVDLWPSKNNFAMTYGADASIALSRNVFLDLGYASAFASIHDAFDDGDNMGFGNPTVGVHIVGAPMPNLHLFAGGSVTAPLLHDPSEQVANAAFYGMRIRGYYDADRFALGHMAVRASGGLEWRAAGPLFVRAELRPVLFIPTNGKFPVLADTRQGMPQTDTGRASLVIEDAVEIEARADFGLGAGARFQMATTPMEKDAMQTVVEPFVSMTPKRKGFFMRVGLPLALDQDLGFGLDEDKLAGIKVQIGGQF